MREGIGFSTTISIISLFIVITFAFLMSTVMYYKAYKINNAISSSIEKYEGYNDLAKAEINNKLDTLGYVKGSINCPAGYTSSGGYMYCVQENSEAIKSKKNNYYKYKIITYLTLDLSSFNLFLKIPIKTTTENIYYFSEN